MASLVSSSSIRPIAADLQLLDRSWPAVVDRHPAQVYLARLALSGRRSQGSALEQIARLLPSGRLGWQELPWHLVLYQHAAAVRSCLADHRAPSTANTYRSALRGVMRECWRLGYLKYDGLARILDVEAVHGSRLLRGRALSRGELVAVFGHLVDQPAAAARRDAALVAILCASGGVRRAEASSLQLGDLDRATGRLVVRGKGNREREVWLSDEAIQAVEDWLLVRGEEPGALLLPVEKDRRTVRHREPDGSPARLSESTVRLACRRRAAQAGLRAFSPHDLRRTSISDLLDLTGDLSLVSELAGHGQPGHDQAVRSQAGREPARGREVAARALPAPGDPCRCQRTGSAGAGVRVARRPPPGNVALVTRVREFRAFSGESAPPAGRTRSPPPGRRRGRPDTADRSAASASASARRPSTPGRCSRRRPRRGRRCRRAW